MAVLLVFVSFFVLVTGVMRGTSRIRVNLAGARIAFALFWVSALGLAAAFAWVIAVVIVIKQFDEQSDLRSAFDIVVYISWNAALGATAIALAGHALLWALRARLHRVATGRDRKSGGLIS